MGEEKPSPDEAVELPEPSAAGSERRRDFLRHAAQVAAIALFGGVPLEAVADRVVKQVGWSAFSHGVARSALLPLRGIVPSRQPCEPEPVQCEPPFECQPPYCEPIAPWDCLFQYCPPAMGECQLEYECPQYECPEYECQAEYCGPAPESCGQPGQQFECEGTQYYSNPTCPSQPQPWECHNGEGGFQCDEGNTLVFQCGDHGQHGQGMFTCDAGEPFTCTGDLSDFLCDQIEDAELFSCQTNFECDTGHTFECDSRFDCPAQVHCKGGGEPCNEPGHGLYTCRPNWNFDGTTGDFRCGGNGGLGDDGFDCDRNTIQFSCAEGADHDDFRCCGDGLGNDACFTCGIGSHFAGCKTPADFLCTIPGFVDDDPIYPQGLGGSACEPSSGFSEQL